MATNLVIDHELLEEAKMIGGRKTKKTVVTEALKEYIQVRKQLEVVKLFGTIEYDSDCEYKSRRKIH